MQRAIVLRLTGRLLAAGALAVPLALSAQTGATSQEADWRRANDAVGAFKRGHGDVLKWERANPTAEAPTAAPVTGLKVPTAEEAVRHAWRVHRDLVRTQNRLGPDNVQRIATGRWMALDPGLQRRVDDVDELLEVAARARKAWIEAVAAQRVVRLRQASLAAAQLASELGQRMVSVGNWSRLQQSPVQIAHAAARMALQRARYAAAQAGSDLIGVMGLTGIEQALDLPDQLPELAAAALPETELLLRAAAIQRQLPDAERLRNQALSLPAIQAYQSAHALALDSRAVRKEREFVAEETVLHYNGMLKSVWELLDETRNRAQAAIDEVGAERDFWLAEADLQWVLQGGGPDQLVSLGGGAQAPQAGGH